MCLIVQGKANLVRSTLLQTSGLIESIYQKNGDGLGIMYGTTDGVKVVKKIPHNADAFRDLITRMPDDEREVALHARWRTHGDINHENTHPYPVNGHSYLMHNGVLHTGNSSDLKKSDTWHFIKDYMADATPDVLHSQAYRLMVEEFINDNRFVIMSHDGRMTIMNRASGIEVKGMWFSNTYAWDPELLGYRMPKYSYGAFRSKWSALKDEDGDYDTLYGTGYAGTQRALGWSPANDVLTDEEEDQEVQCFAELHKGIEDFDADVIEDHLALMPMSTINEIMWNYRITQSKHFDPVTATPVTIGIVNAWTNGDKGALGRYLANGGPDAPNMVAECLMWYCDLEAYEDMDPVVEEVIDATTAGVYAG